MKKIMISGITHHTFEDMYAIDAEHSEAEHGEEWDGNVLGYADNALNGDLVADGYSISEEFPSGIQLDKGHASGRNFVYVLDVDGRPIACYWLSE